MSLMPILISGQGRSGGTALMALLASDPRVAFARSYPFEHHHVSLFTHFAAMLEWRGETGFLYDGIRGLENFPRPGQTDEFCWEAPHGAGIEYLEALWSTFCKQTLKGIQAPATTPRRRTPGRRA